MKDKLLSKFLALVVISTVLTNFGCQHTLQSEVDKAKITAMYRQYAQEFPQVKGITVEQLQQLQQNVILIDVRSPSERAVSVIEGAITTQEFEQNLKHYQQSNAIIVAYCTIGYRSGKYAQKLKQQGVDILNLEGSLLAWSHIQGELVNAKGATNKVHVFGRRWQLTADNYQPVW